jgi:membrane fusion protein, heavy metal efflux system
MKKSVASVIPLFLAAVLLSGCGPRPVAETGEHREDHAEDHAEDHSDLVRLTPAARRNAGIVVAPAGPGSIAESIPLYGVLKPNAEAVRSVAARFPGVVRSVSAVVGQSVQAGSALATVESNESLQVYAVTSPLAGVVTERFTNVGEQTGTEALFTVANLSTLWAELSLFPRDRSRIRVGQSVDIRVTGSDRSIAGRIVFISPLGSAASQSITVRVAVDNGDGALMPGLHVRGDVGVSETGVPVAVPAAALQELEGGQSVFIEDEDGFEPRVVRTGRTDGRTTEILEGLAAGEQVVVEGSFVLKAELGKGEAEHEH